MFRETLFFKTALYSAYDWLAKIRQPIFCRVPSALQLLSVSAFQNWRRGNSCVVERCASGTNPFRHFALRNATSPEGGGLGKEGRFRPYSSTAGRSLLLSCKLFASAKASPFRERWHGEAVTERVCSPSQIFFKFFYFPCRRQAPCFVLEYRGERKAPAKRAWRASAPNRTERRPCRHDEPGIRRNGASISEPGLHGLPPAGTG